MRLLIEGVSPTSRSGPNSFARKLTEAVRDLGHQVSLSRDEMRDPSVRLLFIQGEAHSAPTALRLDGIYFNTRQDWQAMNAPIRACYESADLIVHQTDFDKRLIESFFGVHPRSAVIRNGADTRKTMAIQPLVHPVLDNYAQTWVCAASWRPHKRLTENIRYFQENAGPSDCLVVAGDVSQAGDIVGRVSLDRVLFVGDVEQDVLTALYKRSSHFVHLAWLDHCPNVVADARAAGCRIVCSSSGGTEEIAGLDAIVVDEATWDLTPLDLYSPPKLDFSKTRPGRYDHINDMRDVALLYVKSLQEISR